MLKKEEYDETRAFEPNTTNLKMAWEVSRIEFDVIAYKLCQQLFAIKFPASLSKDEKSKSYFTTKREKHVLLTDFLNRKSPYESYDIKEIDIITVLKSSANLLRLVGIKPSDKKRELMAKMFLENYYRNGYVTTYDSFTSFIGIIQKQYNKNKARPRTFADFSLIAVNQIAQMIQHVKEITLYDLIKICANYRANIACLLDQQHSHTHRQFKNEHESFGSLRSHHSTWKESCAITFLTADRYKDQLPFIYNHLKNIAMGNVEPKACSEYFFADQANLRIMSLIPDTELEYRIPITAKLLTTPNPDYHLYLKSGTIKDVSELYKSFNKKLLSDFSNLSDSALFYELGKIYHDIADTCPYVRGSASIAQMTIFSIMKSLGKTLIPFSTELKINPDILASLIPREEFAKNFQSYFNQELYKLYYTSSLSSQLSKLEIDPPIDSNNNATTEFGIFANTTVAPQNTPSPSVQPDTTKPPSPPVSKK